MQMANGSALQLAWAHSLQREVLGHVPPQVGAREPAQV
jgi:hypothetical protein